MIGSAVFAGAAVFFLLPGPGRAIWPAVRPDSWRRRLGWLLRRGPAHARREHATQAAQVIELALALAAELRAGQTPLGAWLSVSRSESSLSPAFAEGDNVAGLLRAGSVGRGRAGLAQIAACWEVAEQSGAGLAEALTRVSESLRQEQEIESEIDGQLAGPRATARLLIVLPAFALILGESLGAQPTQILLTTGYGWACLAGGSVLAYLGWRWVEHQVRSITPWTDA